jgi:hypothetical protein
MKVDVSSLPFPVSPDFVKLLNDEIDKVKLESGSSVTLNFRDPDYSAEDGGFHPVEIRFGADGNIEYVTDFAYVGPFELAKEIDFDFANSWFQHFGREYPLSDGRELFSIYCQNFTSYHAMGVYEVDCVTD